MIKIIFLILILLFPASSWAACSGSSPTWTCAASCTNTEMQACLDGATNGDTINIPSGTHTWSAAVSKTGYWTIKGAGKASTTINFTGSARALDLYIPSGSTLSISDLTFDFNAKSYSNGLVSIEAYQGMGSANVKISNINFSDYAGSAALMFSGHPYGAVWGCDFTPTATSDGGIGVMVTAVSGSNTAQWTSWRASSAFGTANALFFEDNTWDYPDRASSDIAIDVYSGSRTVVRYNTIKNTILGGHGLDSGTNQLSPVSVEWYYNSFQKNGTNYSPPWAGNMRGGTGVIHHNTFSSAWDSKNAFNLQNFRSCTGTSAWENWQLCNGNTYYMCSNINTNGSVTGYMKVCQNDGECTEPYTCTAKFCSVTKDQVCYVDGDCPGGESCNGTFDGTGTSSYPCRDQIGRGANQALQPVYGWSNATITPVTVTLGQDTCGYMATHVQENRDYYNSTLSGYSAYTYPHPLRDPAEAQNPRLLGGTLQGGVIR